MWSTKVNLKATPMYPAGHYESGGRSANPKGHRFLSPGVCPPSACFLRASGDFLVFDLHSFPMLG